MTLAAEAFPLVIFGAPFHQVDNRQTVTRCVEIATSGRPGFVATPNLDFVMQAGRDPELYRILARADLVIADGMPIVWLAKSLGPALPERVAGSDLVIALAEAAAKEGLSIFNLGGAPGVPEKAAEALQSRFEGLEVAGTYSPPKADLLEMDHGPILERLDEAAPDILYVAFGAPKQEKWINLHVREWKVGLALGIGGSLDFLAGAQTRAPKWMQKSGTEWIWRFATNPRRLWKRYGANLIFLMKALVKVRRMRRRDGTVPPLPEIASDLKERVHWKSWQAMSSPEEVMEWTESLMQETPDRPLVLDLSTCEWMDSRELGVCMTLGRQWREAEASVFVVGESLRMQEWLQFNGLDNLFEPLHQARQLEEALQDGEEHAAVRHEGEELILTPPSELTAGTLPAWREEVEAGLEAGTSSESVVVEASGLRFLDSAGLGYWMGLRARMTESGGRFRVKDLQGPARMTVRLAKAERFLCEGEEA